MNFQMNHDSNLSNTGFFLKSSKSGALSRGEQISEELLEKLKNINDKYTKTKSFPEYEKSIRELFHLQEIHITKESLAFLAGFIEGEGSVSVGAKKNSTSRMKVYLDPEFNMTQHFNGVSGLYLALKTFQTGRIRHKPGSHATLVLTIHNRKNLEEKVVPFYEKHVNKFGSRFKQQRVANFKKILQLFNEQAHLDPDRMLHEVLPLWDALRIQVGQSNQTFKSLKDAQDYVRQALQSSKQTSSKSKKSL